MILIIRHNSITIKVIICNILGFENKLFLYIMIACSVVKVNITEKYYATFNNQLPVLKWKEKYSFLAGKRQVSLS